MYKPEQPIFSAIIAKAAATVKVMGMEEMSLFKCTDGDFIHI